MQLAYKSSERVQHVSGRYDILKEGAFFAAGRRLPSQSLAARHGKLTPHLRINDLRPGRSWWGPPKEDNPQPTNAAPPPPPPKPASKGVTGGISAVFRVVKGLLDIEDEPLPPSTLGGEVTKNDKYWRTLDL
jgi:hypothetical protein